MLPQRVRDGIRFVINGQFRRSIRAARARVQHRAQVDVLVTLCEASLWAATGGKVASGPFQGMPYIRGSVGSQWAPKLLGTYELEIASVMEDIVTRAPARIIDIGAAEGYYAVGLAWRLPATQVLAYEGHEDSHARLKELATLNGVVDRILIRGMCNPGSMNESLDGAAQTVVICDVEGAELPLLDPAVSPALSRADLLVEVHPWAHERMSQVLRQRFQSTHNVREIPSRPRAITDLPAAACELSDASALACMDETRPCPMSWLWMTAV